MSSLKILVVEDDPANLELMSEVLSSLKADVHGIGDSREAAERVGLDKFDGIFLDLEMPHLNGFELARVIRKSSRNKATPIVIVTGREERHTMEEAFSIGVTFFLQKPVDRSKLTKLFRTVRGIMLENRRRSARVPFQADVICHAPGGTQRGVSWNLSQGGIQVETGNLRPGETVRLSFRLPGTGILVEAVGVVAWAQEKRQGIQFTNLNAQNHEAIRRFIADVEKPDWL